MLLLRNPFLQLALSLAIQGLGGMLGDCGVCPI